MDLRESSFSESPRLLYTFAQASSARTAYRRPWEGI